MNVFLFWEYLISCFFLVLFLFVFAQKRYSYVKTALLCGITFLLVVITDYYRFVYKDTTTLFINILILLFQILFVQVLAFIISDFRDFRAIFIGLCSSNYVLIGNAVATSFYIMTKSIVISLLFAFFIHICVLILLEIEFKRPILAVMKKSDINWAKLSLIPILFYMVFYSLEIFPKSIYEVPTNLVALFLALFTMFASYVIEAQYLQQCYEKQEAQQKLVLMDAYANGIKIQSKSLEKSEAEIRIMRHDLRHFLNVISILLEQKEYDKVNDFLAEYVSRIKKEKYAKLCDNTVLNGILHSLEQHANQRGITMHISAVIPENISISSMDIALVISNLIENALKATFKLSDKEEKLVTVTIRTTKEKLIMEIKNTFNGEIFFDEDSGLPISNEGENHGFGMQSVEAFVWKYNGIFDFYVEKSQFIARIIVSL